MTLSLETSVILVFMAQELSISQSNKAKSLPTQKKVHKLMMRETQVDTLHTSNLVCLV